MRPCSDVPAGATDSEDHELGLTSTLLAADVDGHSSDSLMACTACIPALSALRPAAPAVLSRADCGGPPCRSSPPCAKDASALQASSIPTMPVANADSRLQQSSVMQSIPQLSRSTMDSWPDVAFYSTAIKKHHGQLARCQCSCHIEI